MEQKGIVTLWPQTAFTLATPERFENGVFMLQTPENVFRSYYAAEI